MFDEKNFLQDYKGYTIMKESFGGTYLIFRNKKWYEKLIPKFILPNEIVLARGIETIEDGKFFIDHKN